LIIFASKLLLYTFTQNNLKMLRRKSLKIYFCNGSRVFACLHILMNFCCRNNIKSHWLFASVTIGVQAITSNARQKGCNERYAITYVQRLLGQSEDWFLCITGYTHLQCLTLRVSRHFVGHQTSFQEFCWNNKLTHTILNYQLNILQH